MDRRILRVDAVKRREYARHTNQAGATPESINASSNKKRRRSVSVWIVA